MNPNRALVRSLLLTVLLALLAGKFWSVENPAPASPTSFAGQPAATMATMQKFMSLAVTLPRLPPTVPSSTLPTFEKIKSPAEIMVDARITAENMAGANIPAVLKIPVKPMDPALAALLEPDGTVADPFLTATDLGEVYFSDGVPRQFTLNNGQILFIVAIAQPDGGVTLRWTHNRATAAGWSQSQVSIISDGGLVLGQQGESVDFDNVKLIPRLKWGGTN